MRQIRPNVYEVSYSELGRPDDRGTYEVEGLGPVILDVADLRYARENLDLGAEPSFFVSRSGAMGEQFVVVSRQRVA